MLLRDRHRDYDGDEVSIWVYVAGPYSDDHTANTRKAVKMGTFLRIQGFVPIVPHLSMFWDFLDPAPYVDWLAYDLELLAKCDALLRLPGQSQGADKEVAWALDHDIVVFHDFQAVLDCYGVKT